MSLDPSKHQRGRFGKFVPTIRSEAAPALPPAYSLDLIRSRGLLIDVLRALAPHREALTVVGAHAVFERTRELEPVLISDTTRDADLGVTPGLLTATPLVSTVLGGLGLEEVRASLPGAWGLVSEHDRDLHDRLTIDLIAPASLAGPGRRAAKVGEHGPRSVSKTAGTELTSVDRSLMQVSKLDGGDAVETYVAGHAALICAKAYKLFDRLDDRELRRNRQRLRTKDAGDVYRLMATSDPHEVRETFDAEEADPSIGEAVRIGRERLLSIREPMVDLARMHLQHVFPEDAVVEAMNDWLNNFDTGR